MSVDNQLFSVSNAARHGRLTDSNAIPTSWAWPRTPYLLIAR
jgi:hypothetical protein